MSTQKKNGWNRRAVLAGMAGAAAMASVGRVAAQAKTPIRIGGTLALTGPLAQTSLIHKITAEVYVELLNKRGGLLGRPVEYIVLDDQSKPEMARSLYEKLITVDKVDLIMGPYGTGNILAAMGVAERYNKILIQGTFGMPHLAKYPMQFPASPIGPTPNKTVPTMVIDLLSKTKTPPKTVAVITSKFPSAHFISGGVKEAAEAKGMSLKMYLDYEFGTRDFGAIAARVKDADPDFLWVGALGLDSVQVLDALKKIDYKPKRHYHLFAAPGPLVLSPEAGGALSYSYFEEHEPFTKRPGVAEMVAGFRTKAKAAGVGYPYFDFQTASMMSMWQLLEKSVNATKSLDDKKMADWLKGNKVETALGNMSFDGPNNHGPDQSKVKQVIDKKWVVVWPPEFAPPGVKPMLP
ncbi:MAG: amino acid ABC transporter substrate-binding protein [Alphaproteobacteria bacterium]